MAGVTPLHREKATALGTSRPLHTFRAVLNLCVYGINNFFRVGSLNHSYRELNTWSVALCLTLYVSIQDVSLRYEIAPMFAMKGQYPVKWLNGGGGGALPFDIYPF